MQNSKKRTAVFVEGQAELLFVRECLLKFYFNDPKLLGFDCYNLVSKNLEYTPYHWGDASSENYYMLVNVGNDNHVVGAIRQRYSGLSAHYNTIVGLRDMFCEAYKKDSQGKGISPELNEHFIQMTNDIVREFDEKCNVKMFFAIMEVETWLIALCSPFDRLNSTLTIETIKEKTGYNLTLDPEQSLFHPAQALKEILCIVGMKYGKHEKDVLSLMSNISREDIEMLAKSNRCQSFNSFWTQLVGS